MQHVAQQTHWHRSYSDANSSSYFGPITNGTVYNDDLLQRRTTSTTTTPHSETVEDETTIITTDTDEKSTPTLNQGVPLNDDEKNIKLSSPAEEPKVEVPTPTRSPLTEANLAHFEHESSKPISVPQLTLPQGLHLANDIALALVTAQNLRKLKRQETTLKALKESLDRELQIVKDFGDEYIPTKTTKLDHQVALTRELIASHTIQQVFDWQDNTKVNGTHPHGCIFNYTKLNPFAPRLDEKRRLDNYLLSFAKASIDTLNSSKAHKKQFLSALKTLLSSHKMESSLEWLTTAPLNKIYLDDEHLLKHEKDKLDSMKRKTSKSKLVLKETEPPMPTKTKVLIDTKLPELVHTELNKKATTFEGLPNNLKEPIFITKMITHIIRHNPRWNTTPFCVTTHITESALSHSDVEALTYETILLSHGLTDLLRKLRDQQL